VRWCPVCGEEMGPEFASPCEDPIAWTCPACGTLQLETGGRPFTPEQTEVIREIGRRPVEAPAAPADRPAVRTAREVRSAFGLGVPVDVEQVAALLAHPVEWVRRPAGERGGVARTEGGVRLLLNRDYPFTSEGERRWVIAEELAHAVLGHTALAASPAPGAPDRLLEAERAREEREARAFAAELLMPAAEVRQRFRRYQALLAVPSGRAGREEAARRAVGELAREFQVTPTAMRVRLEELGLLR